MKNFYYILNIIALFLIGQVQKSYSQDWQWAISCGKGTYDDYGTIAIDAENNIYLTGNFGGNWGIFGQDTLLSVGYGGNYLMTMFCKMNTAGLFQWTKGITSSGYPCNENLRPKVVTNSHFTGAWFYGRICGIVNFESFHFEEMNKQVFIAKYDENGNCQWAKEAGGQGDDYSWEACVDDHGNIYLSGIVFDSAQFDSFRIGPGIFLAKYDISGNCIWVNKIADHFFYVAGMAVNENQIILVSESIGIGAMFTISGIPIDGSKSNLIMASYDTEGNVQWAKAEGEGGGFFLSAAGFDSQNDFYITGGFANLILGPDTLTPPEVGTGQQFVAKYDNNGNFGWATKTAGGFQITPAQICLDRSGNIFITGMLEPGEESETFGECPVDITLGSRAIEMFVVRYAPEGACTGLMHVPVDSNFGVHKISAGTSVATDSSGNCIVAGQFINSTVFNPYPLTSEGAKDIYIAKCNSINGILQQDQSSDNRLVIYANPTAGTCNITVPNEFLREKQLTLRIYDGTGKLIQQKQLEMNGGKIKLNLDQEAKGIYNVTLSNGRKIYTGKIIFQ